jgi:hypothetical protein
MRQSEVSVHLVRDVLVPSRDSFQREPLGIQSSGNAQAGSQRCGTVQS